MNNVNLQRLKVVLQSRITKVIVVIVAIILTTFMTSNTTTTAWQNGLVEVTNFGSNPGNLRMLKYVPSNLPPSPPLVVALHGCSQNATNYDNETGWIKFADQWGFILLFPEQRSANNFAGCFNWFEPGDNVRGSGEALSIKQMVDRMKTDHNVDSSRVFVTGLSAGGAMTSVMLAVYPEVFAGGAIIAGIPYKCANGSSDSFNCLSPGKDFSAQEWGNRVRAATSYSGPWPKVSIWHGTSDTTVRPLNANESLQQWTNIHGIDEVADVEETIKGYPHKIYKDTSGKSLVETYLITNQGHGVAVDPGSAQDQCGATGAFIIDANICSSYQIARFWGLDNSDQQAPTVSITSPANGSQVSGSVVIQAQATDNIGVSKVEFYVDGRLLGTDNAAPWTINWNSSLETNGSHSLSVKAFDTSGNTGIASISVSVIGGIEDITAPTVNLTSPVNGATLNSTVSLKAMASDDFGVTKVEFYVDGLLIGNGATTTPAGTWQLQWDSRSVTNGTHSISVRAYDAKGNIGVDDDTTVTVNQNVSALEETFSDRDGNGDLFDVTGWSLGNWTANADNNTPVTSSQSIFGYASSGISCAGGNKTKTLSRTITLGTTPKLSYFRKLDLKAGVNISTSASFKVFINNTVVDQRVVTNSNYVESVWTSRANIDLSAFANQTVTLKFEVAANSNVCIEVFAKALIDDITISN